MYWSERFCDKWEKRCGASTGFSRSLFLFHSHDELTLSSDLFYPSGRTINFDFVQFRWHLNAFKTIGKMAAGVWCDGDRALARRQSTDVERVERMNRGISNCMLLILLHHRSFGCATRSLRVCRRVFFQMASLVRRHSVYMGNTYKSQQCQCHERDRAFSFNFNEKKFRFSICQMIHAHA